MKQETMEPNSDLINVKEKQDASVCYRNLSELKLKNLQSLFKHQK